MTFISVVVSQECRNRHRVEMEMEMEMEMERRGIDREDCPG